MPELLSEEEISSLIGEKKSLPADYRSKIQVRPKRGHKERRFSDLKEAISCLISDCGFEIPPGTQKSLFEEV